MTIDEKDWRKLCALVAEETDPHRLCELLDRLVKALNARRQELHHGGQQSTPAAN
ncbi:MAG: hypothetical protein WCA13_17250 [Terriglobales bacterium]